ncbi:LysE family translocator [Marinomonas sp.]|nr:LysE family translocator [Marinomonas sp.]MDB4837147.1 LysE family translocator [Marinomonas sp.]
MSLFIVWFGVMFPLVFSPGPANIVFAMSGAKVGVKRSIPLIAGVDTVFILKSILIGFGLGEVLKTQPLLMNSMQLIGSVYLLYLAAKFFTAQSAGSKDSAKLLGFMDGVLVQLLNSKGWLMVFLMFTLFAEHAQANFAEQGVVVLIAWLAILNISVHFIWVSMGGLLSKVSSSKLYEKVLNGVYSASLALVAIWLLAENPLFS